MAPHSSILAWKSLWMEEPGRLQSMGLQESGLDLGAKPPHIRLFKSLCIVYIRLYKTASQGRGLRCLKEKLTMAS